MTPRFHANGASFAGCAQYLLHDVDAATSGRVEWTETVNLSTHNPEAAWRVMAAVSMQQDALKEAAGIKPGGRNSKQHVGHFSISWNPEEGENVSREEKLRVARALLAEIGAADRQALIVSHHDTEHHHIHVMWNRVGADGRILSPKWSKNKASRFSQKYEEDRVRNGVTDKVYCPQRVANNKLRDQGIFVKYDGYQSRDQYEKSRAKVEQDKKWQTIERQRRKMADMLKAKRDLAARHGHQKTELARRLSDQKATTKTRHQQQITKARQRAADSFRTRWQETLHRQEAQLAKFTLKEKDLRGRLENIFALIDFGAVFGTKKPRGEGKAATLREIFDLNDEGKRREYLLRQHRSEQQRLRTEQRQAEASALRRTRQEHRQEKAQAVIEARLLMNDLALKQKIEASVQRSKIAHEGRSQRQELGLSPNLKKTSSREAASRPQTVGRDQSIDPKKRASAGQSRGPANDNQAPTRASDLAPREGADKAAAIIESYKAALKLAAERKASQDLEKTKGRDDDGRGRS